MICDERETFVSTWLAKLKKARADSKVQKAIDEATTDDTLDENALLNALVAEASDSKEGENVPSGEENHN